MSTAKRLTEGALPNRLYSGPEIPLSAISANARQVGQTFLPERIILFGSYAYGKPTADSDVDLLVIMPARNQLDQAFKIRLALPAAFPLDLIVRTPTNIKGRLKDGDSFLTEILSRGKVLYERDNRRVGAKGRDGPRSRPAKRPKRRAAS